MKCTGRNCSRKPKYEIIYDCGIENQEIILCDYHHTSDSVFQRNIKSIKEIKN